jgi:hypothetical protein
VNVQHILTEIRALNRIDAQAAADLVGCIACEFRRKAFNIGRLTVEEVSRELDYAAAMLDDECVPPSIEQLSMAAKEKREEEKLAEVLGK